MHIQNIMTMHAPVKDRPEIYDNVVEILLMLKVFLDENLKIEYLPSSVPSCSKR